MCWILVTFAAIVLIVLSSNYGRHFHSESVLENALEHSTNMDVIILNQKAKNASHVHSSSIYPFLKRNATVNNSNMEKLGTIDFKNTSSTEAYMAEERDWHVDSPTEIVPLIETESLEEYEEFVFEELYFNEVFTPQVLDELPPPLDSPITQTPISAPTMTSNNEAAVDTATPLPMEEDLDFFDDTFTTFPNEEDLISIHEEVLEEADGSLISDELLQEQLFNNSDDPIGLAIQLHRWTAPSPQVHEEGAKSAETTNEDLIFEHDTLQLMDELKMETEVPGTSEEYTDFVQCTLFDVVDSRSNTSSVLVTKALQNEETIVIPQASSTLSPRRRKPNNRIAIVAILCAALALIVALYLRRKALHSSVDRYSLNSFSHDSGQSQITTPDVQPLSSSATVETQDMDDTCPVEAEMKRVSSRNAKAFHALQGGILKRFEFLHRKTHKRKIQPLTHTPATFHLDSLPPELWAISLQPSEPTL